jgi:hypothetical protein
MARTTRRIIRRSTYPRPSLLGVTPSPISITAVRVWSVTTRSATSSSARTPYGRPDSSVAWFRTSRLVSIS